MANNTRIKMDKSEGEKYEDRDNGVTVFPKLALFSTSTGTNNSDGIGLCTFNLEMQ